MNEVWDIYSKKRREEIYKYVKYIYKDFEFEIEEDGVGCIFRNRELLLSLCRKFCI